MRWILIIGIVVSWVFGAAADTGYIKELKAYLTAKPFEIKGIMYTYDFNNDDLISYNEWVYESAVTGRTYRLLGTTPTPDNNFGFAPVEVNLSDCTPQGYFIFINFPRDQKKIFSWVYLSAISGKVYKLMGATPQHRFDYLALEDLTFTIEDGKAFLVYKYQEKFPNIIGAYDTPGFSWSVDVQGSLAYVADGVTGIQVLDISNPTDIALYTQIPSANALDIAAGGEEMELAADEQEGLVVIDTHNMQKVANFHVDGGDALGVTYDTKRGNAILATDSAGVFVLHVAKSGITLIDHIKNISGATKVVVKDNILYIADSAEGIHMYRLDDEGCAVPLGTLSAQNIKDMAIGARHIYIAYEDSSHIDVVDGFGGERNKVINDEPVYKIVLSPDNKNLYVLNKVASITVYSLQNGKPVKTGKIYLPYPATDMKVSTDGSIGYATCGGDGLKILKLK